MSVEEHQSQVRGARNQSLFREVNERVETLRAGSGNGIGAIDFCCECADTDCALPMPMTLDEYETVREYPSRFAVLPSHVYEDIEIVVERTDRFWIVEKIEDAAQVAATLDPRADPGSVD
jgi:hypothetical protein